MTSIIFHITNIVSSMKELVGIFASSDVFTGAFENITGCEHSNKFFYVIESKMHQNVCGDNECFRFRWPQRQFQTNVSHKIRVEHDWLIKQRCQRTTHCRQIAIMIHIKLIQLRLCGQNRR